MSRSLSPAISFVGYRKIQRTHTTGGTRMIGANARDAILGFDVGGTKTAVVEGAAEGRSFSVANGSPRPSARSTTSSPGSPGAGPGGAPAGRRCVRGRALGARFPHRRRGRAHGGLRGGAPRQGMKNGERPCERPPSPADPGDGDQAVACARCVSPPTSTFAFSIGAYTGR
jgi:hypothetical protein